MILVSAVAFAAPSLAIAGLVGALVQQRRRCHGLQAEIDRLAHDAAQTRTDLRQRTELDTVKDEFISTVSHELRTPLTSIRGALGLLSAGLMGKVDDRAANLLRIASTNTDRLVRLINDILDLERMDSGNAPIRLRPCSLRELVLQAVDTMSSMAQEAGVHLEAASGTQGGTVIFEADPDRLQQVLTNLLSNAIKFSPPHATVRIETSTNHNDLTVRVEDHGRGVPADKLESIFGRFNQVEVSDSRQKGGTGLGLAICRSIVHQHSGEIWAERNDARLPGVPGTTFILRLPRNPATEVPVQPDVQTSGAILVVDDDPGVRHVVAEHIRNQGYTVLEAESGQAALQTAQHQDVEAILLDLYMPGLTGWETIERLKGHPSTASIPIVVLSVLSPATMNRERAPLIGKAHGWVQKPFDPGVLLAELGRVLHRGTGPCRILLVEDDPDLATVVLSSFQSESESHKLRIDHAPSLNEAVRACETNPPELLVLDLSLPDGSGFALVNWLRRQPNLRTLPLVVYSGREVSSEEMEQLRLGPTQFLTKARVQPKEIENLVLAMVRHLHEPVVELPAGR
ncbi:MAG TPA: response regulator [Acidobacteriaceae bacterium]|nr:response regulator [Acidobacteriaceae bacterium]